MNKKGLCKQIVIGILIIVPLTYAMEPSFDLDSITFAPEEMTAARSNNDFLDEFINDLKNSTPAQARIALQTLLEAQLDLFKEKLFYKMNDLNRRSLLNLPLTRRPLARSDAWEVAIRGIYDQTHHHIGSYLVLDSQTLNDNLEELLSMFNTITIDEIIEPMEQLEVVQRSAGFVVTALKRHHNSVFGVRMPLYYLERNYDAPGEPVIDTDFIRDHLVNDKVGIGDTELSWGYYCCDNDWATVVAGAQFTLPTSLTFKNGLYGSPYPLQNYRPVFDMNDVVDLFYITDGDVNAVINQFTNLTVTAIDQMSAQFLDESLGARHHPSIGIFFQPRFVLDDYCTVEGYGSAEYVIPRTEKRFFLSPRHLEEFDTRDFGDDNEARSNITFLSQQLLDALFFNAFNVRVHPGFVFEGVAQVTITYEDFQLHVGADAWAQTKEKFSHLEAPTGTTDATIIQQAKRGAAQQVRLFGGMQYSFERKHPWTVALHADKSVWHHGIGKSFSVVLSLIGYF